MLDILLQILEELYSTVGLLIVLNDYKKLAPKGGDCKEISPGLLQHCSNKNKQPHECVPWLCVFRLHD